MANSVFANGREVCCEVAAGKTVAAFPDVCMTPPQTPATPPGVPIPYPNTGLASDLDKGSKKVQIGGKPVGLKNKSCFKTSSGDEAGSAPMKGVVSHKNKGAVYFKSWSPSVKMEGENVVRHLDMTTNNHACEPGDTPPWVYIDKGAVAPDEHPCKTEIDKAQEACKGAVTTGKGRSARKDCSNCKGNCEEKMACILVPKNKDKKMCCSPSNTGHHLVEVNCFTEPGERGGLKIGTIKELAAKNAYVVGSKFIGPRLKNHSTIDLNTAKSSSRRLSGFSNYDEEAAPTVCASQSVGYTDHGAMHAASDKIKRNFQYQRKNSPLGYFGYGENNSNMYSYWTYDEASSAGVNAHSQLHPHCDKDCMKSQLDNYHVNEAKIPKDEPVRSDFSQNYVQGKQYLHDNK